MTWSALAQTGNAEKRYVRSHRSQNNAKVPLAQGKVAGLDAIGSKTQLLQRVGKFRKGVTSVAARLVHARTVMRSRTPSVVHGPALKIAQSASFPLEQQKIKLLNRFLLFVFCN